MRELKFLKGRRRKVSGIRHHKSKIFKNTGDMSNKSHNSGKEILNVTSQGI